MKALLIQLLLPPVVVTLPWLIPVWRRQWITGGIIALVWSAGLGIMLFKWAGLGALLLLSLGLLMAMTTRIHITDSSI